MQRCSLSVSRRVLPKPKRRAYSVFAHRTEQARQEPEHIPITVTHTRPDPFTLVSSELTQIREHLLSLLGSAHPDLHATAEYLFLQPSVQLRSLLILLFSRATNGRGGSWQRKIWEANHERVMGREIRIENALQDPGALRDWYPTIPDHTASFSSVFELHKPTGQDEAPLESPALSPHATPAILPTQIRLGQIMEMVHVASLLHDGVHDGPLESTDHASNGLGIKLTILGGDFLLGRASAVLPRLGENEVVELVSGIISNLVEGEMLRRVAVKTIKLDVIQGQTSVSEAWERYLKKIYFKTASLMAKGARASVVLGGCQDGDVLKEAAYVYGRNIGFAKQVRSAYCSLFLRYSQCTFHSSWMTRMITNLVSAGYDQV
jgi:hexaprenyl-diphosphate synthase